MALPLDLSSLKHERIVSFFKTKLFLSKLIMCKVKGDITTRFVRHVENNNAQSTTAHNMSYYTANTLIRRRKWREENNMVDPNSNQEKFYYVYSCDLDTNLELKV